MLKITHWILFCVGYATVMPAFAQSENSSSIVDCQPLATSTQEDDNIDKLTTLSLEALMDVKVQATSKTQEKTLRESSGIVTVVTQEEIANSGARDLIDVLRLVPGFDFGVDVYNVVGIGLRGTWAHEGKILLLIDGVEMNERRFSNIEFGNHYPVDHIQRIEVIRGPGSVNYGGFAELGVINIITKTAKEINGMDMTTLYGKMAHSTGRKNLNLMYGKQFDNGVEVTAMGLWGKGRRSDGRYTDFQGNSFDMKDNSALNPHFVNLGLRYKCFSSRLIVDNYRTTNLDFYGPVDTALWKNDFKSWVYQAKYIHHFDDKLKLNLEASYSYQDAWRQDNGNDAQQMAMLTNRYLANASLNYIVNDDLNIVVGTEFYADKAIDDMPLNPRNVPNFKNYTTYTEAVYQTFLGNLTVGARFDRHSRFGSHLAPRIALTKVLDKFHYKLLYSNSFRTPVVENVYLNPTIKPETTNVFEAEIGYQLHKNMALVINVFDIKSKDTIVYGVKPGSETDSYFNVNSMGSRGIEAELRLKQDWGYATLNHSYYAVAHGTADNFRVINFQDNVENNNNRLGLSVHKTTLNTHFAITPRLSINPSLSLFSPRYGYVSADAAGNSILKKFPSYALVNLFIRYKPEFIKNFEVGLGVYDLFNKNPPFLQPYHGGHAPLPSPSREFLLKFSYHF